MMQALNFDIALVGRLFGHRCRRTNVGHTHFADARLIEAAERVGSVVAKFMKAAHQ